MDGDKPQDIYEPVEMLSIDDQDFLIRENAKRLQKRIEYENQLWTDFNRSKYMDLKEAQDTIAAKEHKNMHQVFTKTNGIKAVLHFLTSQQNAVENWLRANSDPAINHVIREEKHPIFGR